MKEKSTRGLINETRLCAICSQLKKKKEKKSQGRFLSLSLLLLFFKQGSKVSECDDEKAIEPIMRHHYCVKGLMDLTLH